MNKIMAFQRVGLTIAALICSIAFLIQTTKPATADNAPNTINNTGRYMMSFQAEYDATRIKWYVLVWDTSTGRSKMYYGDGKMGKITAAGSSYNIPSSPL